MRRDVAPAGLKATRSTSGGRDPRDKKKGRNPLSGIGRSALFCLLPALPAARVKSRLHRQAPGNRESGGIGRRPGFRCRCRKAWGFESPLSPHPTDRNRLGKGKSVSVRLDFRGRQDMKKKKKNT